jgi:protein-disulfide isomerase
MTDHVRGEGAVELTQFADFECPYCRDAAPSIRRVLERLDGRVRLRFRHFPVVARHPHAVRAALAAEAAGAQGRFWEMHDALFRRQKALEDDDLRRYAGGLGLDVERFDSDRAGVDVLARVQRDVDSGIASGEVTGTPTLFIDGVVYREPYDAAVLQTALTR